MEDNRDFMYFSKVTGKPYSTKEELIAAEDEVLEKKKAEEVKKNERAARAKEVEEAFKVAKEYEKKANELLNNFIKDYNSFHMTVKEPMTAESLFDDFFNHFFF